MSPRRRNARASAAWSVDDSGSSPGLSRRITSCLERHGYQVEVVDLTPPCEHVVFEETALDKLAGDEAYFVRHLAGNRRGLIEVSRLSQCVALIAAVARVLPRRGSRSPPPRDRSAQSIKSRLQRRLPEPVLLLDEGGCRRGHADRGLLRAGSISSDVNLDDFCKHRRNLGVALGLGRTEDDRAAAMPRTEWTFA